MTNKDHLRAVKIMTKVLDDQFKFLGIRVGFDPLLDLIPVFGSLVGAGLSLYMVWVAWKLEIPEDRIAQMIKNIIIDLFIGEVPVVGWIGDIFYKSNIMNFDILKKSLPDTVIEGKIVS